MIKKLLILLAVLAIAGCNAQDASVGEADEYGLEDFVSVLETSQDFKDYKSDFKAGFGKEFDPELTESVELDQDVIMKRKTAMENDTSTSAYTVIYDDLPNKELCEVWIFDKETKNRGIVAVLDMDNNDVLKFIAIIRIETVLNANLDEVNEI